MKSFTITVFLFLLFLLLSLPGSKITAEEGEGLIAMDFKDVDIVTVVKFISEMTGKNFILDERVRGKITVICPTRIPIDEAYQVFESILEVKGFSAIPSGKVIKIVPSSEAKQRAIETGRGEIVKPEDRIITQLIPIKYADVTEVVSVISPLISKNANIIPYPTTQTIILTDTASNIRRILDIIKGLDIPGSKVEMTIIPLQYASAVKIATQLSQALEVSVTSRVRTSVSRTTRRVTTFPTRARAEVAKIIPDERTNSLIIIANAEKTQMIKELVGKLDRALPRGKGMIHIYYLENATAEDVAKVLGSMLVKKGKGRTEGGIGLGEEVSIVADKATNSLIITASPEDYLDLEKVIKGLDIIRPQVLVEALIADVNLERLMQLGVEWATLDKPVDHEVRGFGGTKYDVTSPSLTSRAMGMSGLVVGAMKGTITIGGVEYPNLGALIQAYQKDASFRILSTPQLLTRDNEEAKIVVGKTVPYVTSSRITEQDTVVRSYEYKDVGITLKITPHISKTGFVTLKIHQEVTKLVPGEGLAEAPTTTKREAETTVTVKDNATIVIGGLIRNDNTQVLHKVPLLGDIPLLGLLFRRRENTVERRNLLIFITPHIISTPEEIQKLTQDKREAMDEFVKEGWKEKVGEKK